MAKWEDITSHSQNEKDRTPRTYERKIIPGLRLVVTRHIHYNPDQWLLSCGNIFETAIDDCPAKEAQAKAIDLLKKHLTQALKKLG